LICAAFEAREDGATEGNRKLAEDDGMIEQQGLLLVMMDIDPDREEEFNRWYNEEHVQERLAIAGFQRARRYRIVQGSPKYLALYDVANPEVFSSPEYLQYYSGSGETEWTRSILAASSNFTRNIYTKILDRSSDRTR
jgi:hypothetical protein